MTDLTNKLRILAFDPANTDMGWAVLVCDLKTNSIHVEVSGVIKGKNMCSGFPRWARVRLSKPFLSSIRVYDLIKNLIHTYKVHFTCSESAFFGRFPQVWASLSIVIYNIRRAAFEILHDDVHVVAPSETKRTVSGKGRSGKDAVKNGVLKYKNLTFSPPTDGRKITELEEHEYDAIGHGIAFFRLKYPEIQKKYQEEAARDQKEAERVERRNKLEEEKRLRREKRLAKK